MAGRNPTPFPNSRPPSKRSKKVKVVPQLVVSSARRRLFADDPYFSRTSPTKGFSPLATPLPGSPSPPRETKITYNQRKRQLLELLNSGNMKKLNEIQAIGPKTATRIIAYRKAKGSIIKISQLKKIRRFGYKKFLTVHSLNDDE